MATLNRGKKPLISWADSARALVDRRSIAMLFLGFSAGLPILLIFGTLSVWLHEAGIKRSTVTFISWAALSYSFKFIWAPLIDRLPVPYLSSLIGRRRSWMLVSQFSLMFAIFWTSFFDPQVAFTMTAVGAVLIGFCSATQDIVIDAYRIESAQSDMQAILSAMYIAGYRVGMLVAGACALWLADWWGGADYNFSVWSKVYRTMACAMLVGIATTIIIKEPAVQLSQNTSFRYVGDYIRFLIGFLLAVTAFVFGFILFPGTENFLKKHIIGHFSLAPHLSSFLIESLRVVFSIFCGALMVWGTIKFRIVNYGHFRETYIDPIADFLKRYKKTAIVILALIGIYRISDILMGVIANIFYLDMGYTKSQIATYTKFWGLLATMVGGFVGGVFSVRYGTMRMLFLGALLASSTNVLFAYVATQQPNETLLLSVIVADNMSAGIAAAAFVSFLSSLTSVSFTAMQYAIFSSMMTLFPKLLAGYSGGMVDNLGYEIFFVITALIGVPVLLLIIWVGRIVSVSR